MEHREKDIQELCKQVLETYCEEDENRGMRSCPWCGNETMWKNEIKDICHDHECAYLIAKDLSTNH